MNRRNFFRMLGGAVAAAVAAPVVALLPKSAPLLTGQLGKYEGFKVTHVGRSRWKSGYANVHNLPRYGGALKENIVQASAAPAMEFRGDTDTGWYTDKTGGLKFTNCGHTSLQCPCNNFGRDYRYLKFEA